MNILNSIELGIQAYQYQSISIRRRWMTSHPTFSYGISNPSLLHNIDSNKISHRITTTSLDQTSMTSGSFYHAIGSPKFISAPMVEQSSIAFRTLVRRYGVGLAYTEMIHAKSFVSSEKIRKEYVDWIDEYGNRVEGDSPLIAQVAGDDPHAIVETGKYFQHSVVAIDLNLGCPQKIAKRGNYGAYLLQDPKLVLSILTKMVKELDCPVTAKIRILTSDHDTLNLCKEIENCGVQMLTVHGRTVDQNKLYTGSANWNIIRDIKNSLRIPVIANGGISSRQDALRCIAETGVDGVMSSEGLLGNPKLFSNQQEPASDAEYARQQLSSARELIGLFEQFKTQCTNFHQLRGHLFKILHSFLDAPKNIDLREKLADGAIDELLEVQLSLENRIHGLEYKNLVETGYMIPTTWYMRHRDEKALKRITSPRKEKIVPNRDGDTPEIIEGKLQALRQRLLSKKKEHQAIN